MNRIPNFAINFNVLRPYNKVDVNTSDVKNAGTDANVHVQIFGKIGRAVQADPGISQFTPRSLSALETKT